MATETMDLRWRARSPQTYFIYTMEARIMNRATGRLIDNLAGQPSQVGQSWRSIEHAKQLVGDGLEQIAHHRAAAGLEENLGRQAPWRFGKSPRDC